MNQEAGASGLTVSLKVPEIAILGLPVLVTVSVSNHGPSPVTVSSRLNLMEGDLRLLITDPDGKQRSVTGAGGQPDTSLRLVKLPPNQQIVGNVHLLHTDAGVTFPQAGNYLLQAEYSPSPRLGRVTSTPVTLKVQPPKTKAQQGAAALLQNEELRLALTLAEADRAPAELRELAQDYADTQEGKLARLILAGSAAETEDTAATSDVFLNTDPTTAATLITSLSTPFSRVGERLKQSYVAHVESQDTTAGATASAKATERENSLRIVKGEPLKND